MGIWSFITTCIGFRLVPLGVVAAATTVTAELCLVVTVPTGKVGGKVCTDTFSFTVFTTFATHGDGGGLLWGWTVVDVVVMADGMETQIY